MEKPVVRLVNNHRGLVHPFHVGAEQLYLTTFNIDLDDEEGPILLPRSEVRYRYGWYLSGMTFPSFPGPRLIRGVLEKNLRDPIGHGCFNRDYVVEGFAVLQ